MNTTATTLEKNFTVVVETLVNPGRDIDHENPEIKSYWYEVSAVDETEAKQKGKAIFDTEYPYKGIYDIDAI